MSRRLVIWGAGGHGKVVLDIALSTGYFDRVIFIDDQPRDSAPGSCECEAVGEPDELRRFAGASVAIAMGDNQSRARCFARALRAGLAPTTLIHSHAVISPSARISAGTVIMPGAIVNADAVIGENCIVNSAVVVEHDCRIGDHVHLSPRVALGGGVTVGSLAHVGIGAVVLPGAVVGEESVVGAGAVVLKGAPARSTVVGVPAKVLICQLLR
jgi:acetyltransferase EpsM